MLALSKQLGLLHVTKACHAHTALLFMQLCTSCSVAAEQQTTAVMESCARSLLAVLKASTTDLMLDCSISFDSRQISAGETASKHQPRAD